MSVMSTLDEDPLVTVGDALKQLPIKRSWLYDALNKGRVPGVRYGAAWRIRASDVAHMAIHGVPANSDRQARTPVNQPAAS